MYIVALQIWMDMKYAKFDIVPTTKSWKLHYR